VSEKLEGLQEIGRDAVWTVSSAKSGSGVDQVFDGDLSTFWQYVAHLSRFGATKIMLTFC
jgi:hypothetical protein